jgi:hypothetical protein
MSLYPKIARLRPKGDQGERCGTPNDGEFLGLGRYAGADRAVVAGGEDLMSPPRPNPARLFGTEP